MAVAPLCYVNHIIKSKLSMISAGKKKKKTAGSERNLGLAAELWNYEYGNGSESHS